MRLKYKNIKIKPADPEEIVQANINWKKSLTDDQKKFATKMASIKNTFSINPFSIAKVSF